MIVGVIMGGSSDSIRAIGETDFLELARVARTTLQHWLRLKVCSYLRMVSTTRPIS